MITASPGQVPWPLPRPQLSNLKVGEKSIPSSSLSLGMERECVPLFSARPGKWFSNGTVGRNSREIKMELPSEYTEAQNGPCVEGRLVCGRQAPHPATVCPLVRRLEQGGGRCRGHVAERAGADPLAPNTMSPSPPQQTPTPWTAYDLRTTDIPPPPCLAKPSTSCFVLEAS